MAGITHDICEPLLIIHQLVIDVNILHIRNLCFG